MPSLTSKAAHFVSDFTTFILNPISDEPFRPNHDEESGMKYAEDVEKEDSWEPNGPDTSSFTAFLFSFLSSSDTSDPIVEVTETNNINEATDADSDSRNDAVMRNVSKVVAQELKPVKSLNANAPESNVPDISEPSVLLSESMRRALYVSLPVMAKGRKWVLLYSTWRNGMSLATLYRRSMLCPGYSLLVVGDNKGAVFGGLIESPLRPTTMRKYQGTNSSFVFTNLSSEAVIFRPTGANHYYTLCSTDFLALGGGNHFALYLDADLTTGTSCASETFGNSCLSHSQEFEVKEVELWSFVYDTKYEEMVALSRTEKPGICRW